MASIIAAAAECLGEAPPELAQDIMFQGIHLTGGGALLRGMTQRLADATARAGAPGRHAARVRRPGGRRLPRVLRPPEAALHRGRLTSPEAARCRAVRRSARRAARSAAWRTCQSRSSAARRSAGVHPGVVEAGQRDGGAPPHRRLVVQRGEHGRQAGGVADGAERGHRGLAAAGVVVARPRSRQVRHGGPGAPLGQEPGRADDDERVGVGQRGGDGAGQRRAGAAAAGGQRDLDGAPPQRRVVRRRARPRRRRRRSSPRRASAPERRHLHAGIGIGETTAGQGGVPAVPGHGDAAAPHVGAAVAALIRGNIVVHLPSMSEPDATADGEAAANPTSSDARPRRGRRPDAPARPGHRDAGAAGRPARRRRRLWPKLLAGFAVIARRGGAGRRPHRRSTTTSSRRGTPRRSSQYIHVPAADNHPLTGKILLTDVYVTQLNALNYLQYRFFDSDSQVISGPGSARPHDGREPVSRPGVPRNGAGPDPSPRRRRCPTSATRSRRRTRAR